MRLIDLLYLNVDKKILNISISILMLTLTLSIFQITDRVNQYISTQENILLQQQEIIISAKDLSSDLSLFAVLYFEIYLYDNNGLGNFDEVEINIKKLIETQKKIESNNEALGIMTKKLLEYEGYIQYYEQNLK
jgi:hypothetical protein|tara:strand:- start:320 stop:721 length:402 start_codon:yes stop_codon:yes gene_type:complete